MAKEFIAAIEIGSSKMTGVAGRKNPDGSITVLAVVKEDSSACISKGVVYKVDKTIQCISNIIEKLKAILKTDIACVYVGEGGKSVRSVKNTIVRDLPADTVVSQEMVDSIMDANRQMIYPDYEILDVVTQEYKVDLQHQVDPVGIQASHVEGNFLNILWRRTFARNLKKCFDDAGIYIADMYPSALVLAEAVLTDAERRTGCLLVDMGADTTTVAVFYRNLLRHLAVIPLGGSNITKDIESLQIDYSEAEMLKLKYASAYTEDADFDKTRKYPIAEGRFIDSITFIKVVEARVREIVENVFYQVPEEYTKKLNGGIILTGGASNMPNIAKVFMKVMKMDNVRIAKVVNGNITSAGTKAAITSDGTMCTILGLLMKGNTNCAGGEINDLFSAQERAKAARLEQERKKREQEEAERKAAEEAARLEEEKRNNTPVNKLRKRVKGFINSIVIDPNESKE